ncbi:MAG: single-stranded DNA-binding protein, partial [Treponema sp.]|nr:single-stranded DNA-binding protein [Treponema sp.]
VEEENMMNQIILEGKIRKVGDLRTNPAGTTVLSPVVATERFYTNANGEKVKEVSYFDLAVYGKLAEVFSHKSKEGDSIRVVGRLKQDRWRDDTGKMMSKVNVVCEHVDFMSKTIAEAKEEKQPVEKKVEEDGYGY